VALSLSEADRGPFALFDDDAAGAYLLTDLRPLSFDATADACQILGNADLFPPAPTLNMTIL